MQLSKNRQFQLSKLKAIPNIHPGQPNQSRPEAVTIQPQTRQPANPKTEPTGAYLVAHHHPVKHQINKTQRRVFRPPAAVPPAFLSRVLGANAQTVNEELRKNVTK